MNTAIRDYPPGNLRVSDARDTGRRHGTRPSRPPRPRRHGASAIAAAALAATAVANALSTGPSMAHRELAREILARQGLSIPLPPARASTGPARSRQR
jgi:hypothetical protein